MMILGVTYFHGKFYNSHKLLLERNLDKSKFEVLNSRFSLGVPDHADIGSF